MCLFIKKQREFIVEERDVTTVLEVVNRHTKTCNHWVNRCGWADEPTKWFIMFDATDRSYGRIMGELHNIGDFRIEVSNKGKTDLYFDVFEVDDFEEDDYEA